MEGRMKHLLFAASVTILAQAAFAQEAEEASPEQMLDALMQEGEATAETEAEEAPAPEEAEGAAELAMEADNAPDVADEESVAPEAASSEPEEEPAPLKDWSDAYDDSFVAYPFWSGEYPNGFETGAEPVTVKGRLVMSPASPRSVSCTLPAKANFHPWNADRVSMDSLVFWTVSQPTTITVNEEFEAWAIPADMEFEGDDDSLSLSAGDKIVYKRYLAEGFFIGEFRGTEYEMSEPEITEFVAFEKAEYGDHEWIEVNCQEGFGRRAWLRVDEMLATDGINPSNLTGFGEASDPE